jgi:hypothetical protein
MANPINIDAKLSEYKVLLNTYAEVHQSYMDLLFSRDTKRFAKVPLFKGMGAIMGSTSSSNHFTLDSCEQDCKNKVVATNEGETCHFANFSAKDKTCKLYNKIVPILQSNKIGLNLQYDADNTLLAKEENANDRESFYRDALLIIQNQLTLISRDIYSQLSRGGNENEIKLHKDSLAKKMQELDKYKEEQRELERMRVKETSSQHFITQAGANYLLYLIIVLLLIAMYVQTIGFSIFTLIVICIFIMVYVSFYHGLWIIVLSFLYYYFYV